MKRFPLTFKVLCAGGKGAFFLSLIFFLSIPVYASRADIHVQRRSDELYVSMSYPRDIRPDIVESLENGLRAEITFQLRIYRVTGGIRSLFGDQLIREERFTREGQKDVFSKSYRIFTGSDIYSFSDLENFLDSFYTLHAGSLPFFPLPDQEYYLLGRIIVEKRKLVPPLNLLSLFMKENRTSTLWTQHTLTGSPGAEG